MKLSSLPHHLILLTALIACGCGPHLRREVGIDKRFELSERCAQAPLTLKLRALGSSWGEGLVAQLHAPRAIHGRYELRVNGNRARSGRLITASNQNLTPSGRTKPRWRPDRRADNSHCLRPPEAVVVSGAARGAFRVVETPPGARPGPRAPEPVERGEGLSAPAHRPRGPAGANETPVGDGAGVRPGVAHLTVARWRTIPRGRGHLLLLQTPIFGSDLTSLYLSSKHSHGMRFLKKLINVFKAAFCSSSTRCQFIMG